MNKKILIIGGEGYIGTQLLDYLNSSDKYLTSITCLDISINSNNVKELENVIYIKGKYQDMSKDWFADFTDIILLAGQSSCGNSNNLLNVIDNNIRNFAKLLENLGDNQKLIYASSSSVYGNTNNNVVNEESSYYEPYNYYDWSKNTIDQLATLSGKHYYGLRFGTVNGFSRNLRNDIMINSMCYNAKINGYIYVHNGNVNRPILGINDLTKAILTIINNGTLDKAGIYNLNSLNSNVTNIANTVANICKVPCKNIEDNKDLNFKLQNKSYDFKISSDKFIKTFNFVFEENINSITNDILQKWDNIENLQNRLCDDKLYKFRNNCCVCSTITQSLLNLGTQPLANNYNMRKDTYEEIYPLHLHLCPNCFHTQLNCIVKPDILFKNYLYVSGTSKTLNEFFDYFAVNVLQNISNKNIKILEIACNDGSQLDAFKRYNPNVITVGVDPAENIYKDFSSKKCHDIYCEFFNEKTVDKLKLKYGTFDIIVAQNVFAHIDYPSDFLNYVYKLMNDTTQIYIQTSQKNMILENQFDTVYHEHLSYFNTNSIKILCEQNNLILNNIDEHQIHGTSYIFNISKQSSVISNTKSVLEQETKKGLYNLETYDNYRIKCFKYKCDLNSLIYQYKIDGKSIISFGSTAKSMTVFNFCGINNTYIDYMIDENPLKCGLYTPCSKIQLYSIEYLKNINKDTIILITAWNFYEEIKNKIINILNNFNIKSKITLLNINTLCEEIL